MKQETTLDDGQPAPERTAPASPAGARRLVVGGLLVFLIAFGVRFLAWQDNRYEARKVQTAVTEGYRHTGRLLSEGGIKSFFSSSSPLADPNHLGHPPGYSILMAIVSGVTPDGDARIQLLQITADALAAIVIFLIAAELLSNTTAFIAGLLVALAPQFTYNSTLLLPDTLAVLPVLLAVYCLVRAVKRPALALLLIAGALIGVSCWLRANAMMLAPFIALAMPLFFERGRRLRPALALIGGMLLVVMPLTVRNYVVYNHFIPVSLGAGQTLLEGIADYDTAGTLGIPATDMGIMKMEAETYGRPDYFGMLFNPDGIKRERLRLRRGFGVILSHPFWFAGVMARRGASMLRLERAQTISPELPVTHSLAVTEMSPVVWTNSPAELLAGGTTNAAQTEVSLAPEGLTLNLKGDESKYEPQFTSPPVTVRQDTDYLLQMPVRIEQGRMKINIVNASRGTVYASTIIEAQDWKPSAEQPTLMLQIPFVSRNDGEVSIVFANGGSRPIRPYVQIGQTKLYALGPAANVWLRAPRFLLSAVQKLFITAVMLPLALCGLFLLIRRRQHQTLALLLIVPAYYLCFQSLLHTEYRYVLAIHYFLFVLVALSLHTTGSFLWSNLLKLSIVRRLFRYDRSLAN